MGLAILTAARWAAALGTGTVRDIRVPVGMSEACLNELAALLNERANPENDATNDEMAVAAFEVVRRHQR